MVGVPFDTPEEVGEIEEALWPGFDRGAHHVLKLCHIAPQDRHPVLQIGKRGRTRIDIHADDVFAARDQTSDDAWANKPRTADDKDGHRALPLLVSLKD